VAVIIWLNGPFGVGKTTTAQALLRRRPQAVCFDPEPFGAALRHTVANVETAPDFQDLRGWPALVVETARILREAYAETLIVPLTVLNAASAEALAAGLATVDPDVRRYRLVAPETTLRARILQRAETEGPHAWCLDHLEAGMLLMANAAFGEAVATDNRDPERVADHILAGLGVVRRAATDADRAFARHTHHLAFRDLVERQYGTWVDDQQDGFFESSWAAMPHEIVLSDGAPCGYVCVEDCSDHVHLHELVLKPDYQGQGIGSAVLDLVMEHARARRVSVRLRTSRANRAASLYRRVGFREVGTTNTHLLFEWSDADETRTTLRRAGPPAQSPRDETAPV
jgi:ribosomal protein S18 acetylase RimI-like enzyme